MDVIQPTKWVGESGTGKVTVQISSIAYMEEWNNGVMIYFNGTRELWVKGEIDQMSQDMWWVG